LNPMNVGMKGIHICTIFVSFAIFVPFAVPES